MSSWTQAICDRCWGESAPGREPVRLVARERETCCACGAVTTSGIYVRRDPRLTRFPTSRGEKEWPLPSPAAVDRGPQFESDLETLVDMGFTAEEARPHLERAYDAGLIEPIEHVVRALVTGGR